MVCLREWHKKKRETPFSQADCLSRIHAQKQTGVMLIHAVCQMCVPLNTQIEYTVIQWIVFHICLQISSLHHGMKWHEACDEAGRAAPYAETAVFKYWNPKGKNIRALHLQMRSNLFYISVIWCWEVPIFDEMIDVKLFVDKTSEITVATVLVSMKGCSLRQDACDDWSSWRLLPCRDAWRDDSHDIKWYTVKDFLNLIR